MDELTAAILSAMEKSLDDPTLSNKQREWLEHIGPEGRARVAAIVASERRGETRREELEDGGAFIVETDLGRVLREAGENTDLPLPPNSA